MATIEVKAPAWRGLTQFQSATVKKASSQTFDSGDLVRVASGLATDFSGGASATALAIAGEDASQPEAPDGSPNADVVNLNLLHDRVLAEFNLSGTFAQTDIGAEYGLTTSGGHVVVNKSDTTNVAVKVLALVEGAVGDTTARVLVRFLPDAAF